MAGSGRRFGKADAHRREGSHESPLFGSWRRVCDRSQRKRTHDSGAGHLAKGFNQDARQTKCRAFNGTAAGPSPQTGGDYQWLLLRHWTRKCLGRWLADASTPGRSSGQVRHEAPG